MIARICLLLLAAPLFGAAPSMAIQEVKGRLEELARMQRGQEVELGLLMDRLNSLESKKPQPAAPDSRITTLEKAQKALASDLQTLKKSIESSHNSLASCQKKLSEIDGKLTGEIKSLKNSLHSMLALLQAESSEFYVVKPGDSLGQIALDHKLTIRQLKELNNLSKDTIIVGQKLRLQ